MYEQTLVKLEGVLSQKEFINIIEVTIPNMLCDFILHEMTDKLPLIDIDTPGINFLKFYPFLKARLKEVLPKCDEMGIRSIFFELSASIETFWNKSIKDITGSIQRFRKVNMNSQLLSRILVLYLIRELSYDCQKRIKKNLVGSKLRLVSGVSALSKFIIQRMEAIEFQKIEKEDWNRFDKIVYGQYDEKTAQAKIEELFNKQYGYLVVSPCVQEGGRQGILISDPLNTDRPAMLLSMADKRVIITHSKYLIGWKKFEFTIKQKNCKISFSQKTDDFASSLVTNSLTNIGSSIGYLLANMPDKPTKFLKEFLLSCTICGSMTVILTSIPILGKLIILGGMGYQTAEVLKNTDIDTRRKIEKILGISMSMTVTIGSSVGGAVAGQILIPVPILGGFIGGMVGGIVGGLSSSAAMKGIQKLRVKKMGEELEAAQLPDGSWPPEKAAEIYSVKDVFFTKQEGDLDQRDLVTIFSYFLLSLFESQKEQQKLEELEESMKSKWYRKSLTEEEKAQIKDQMERLVQNVPEVILRAEIYMVMNDLRLADHLELLQKMIQEYLAVL